MEKNERKKKEHQTCSLKTVSKKILTGLAKSTVIRTFYFLFFILFSARRLGIEKAEKMQFKKT